MIDYPPPLPHRPPLTRRQIIALASILLIGAGLRFYRIGRPSLWLDEIWSIEIADGRGHQHDQLPDGIIRRDQIDLTSLHDAPPWWRVWSAASDYTYPPLYPLVLRGWMDFFGNGAAAVRSLSAIFSVAAVAIFFDVLRWLHGKRIALLGAAIIALAGAQLDVAQEARGYAMPIFLALGCADALVRIEKFGATPRRLATLGICLLAGFLTHYLIAGVAGAFLIYVSIRFRGVRRRRTLAAIIGAAALAAAVWGPSLFWQTRHLPQPAPAFLRESIPDRHVELTLRRVAGLSGEYLCGETVAEKIFRQETPANQLLTIALLFLAAATLLAPWARLRRCGDLLIWSLWIAGTIGLVAAADLACGTTMSGYIRYTILASPCVYAIIAAWDWPRRNVLRDGLALAVIVGLVIAAAHRLANGPEPKEDWRTAAAKLDVSASRDDLIVFFSQDPWVAPGIWYVCLHYYLPESNRPWLLLRHRPDESLMRQLAARNSLWLVGVHAETTGELLLPGWQVQKAIPATPFVTICKMTRVRPGT